MSARILPALALLALLALGRAAGAEEKVRLGYNANSARNIASLVLHVIERKALFANEGLAVELVGLPGTTAMVDSLDNGTVDVTPQGSVLDEQGCPGEGNTHLQDASVEPRTLPGLLLFWDSTANPAGTAQIGFADTAAVILGRGNDQIPVAQAAYALRDQSVRRATPGCLNEPSMHDHPRRGHPRIPDLRGVMAITSRAAGAVRRLPVCGEVVVERMAARGSDGR